MNAMRMRDMIIMEKIQSFCCPMNGIDRNVVGIVVVVVAVGVWRYMVVARYCANESCAVTM